MKYLKVYHDDMQALGIKPPTDEPKATRYIKKMVKFIKGLIERGAAYETGGDVYFDIKKAKDYGKLSHQSVDKMEIGARVAPGENKKDPLDFALWKKAKPDEPSWDSPWGKGRPGWHIECSVMSSDTLGDEFDIHCGGIDLIFPHHENEIAQSEGLGNKFARHWLHNGLLTINGEKMAKSQGNFITIKDFLERYKNPDLLKLLFLSAHYSHPVDYTEEKIQEARESFDRIVRFLEKGARRQKGARRLFPQIEEIRNRFIRAMDDDFNSPKGLSCIFELVNIANKNIEDKVFMSSATTAIIELGNIFGLDFNLKHRGSIIKELFELLKDERGESEIDVKDLIKEREHLRKEKKFKEADEIRKMLGKKGMILEDTKDGPVWRQKV